MSTMELLEIPGMDQSEDLFKLLRKSRSMLMRNVACRRLVAARMSSPQKVPNVAMVRIVGENSTPDRIRIRFRNPVREVTAESEKPNEEIISPSVSST